MTLIYSFPKWLVNRVLSFSAAWGSMTNAGASLHLKVPRMVDPEMSKRLWVAVGRKDVDWFREKISAKELLPADIDEDGDNIVDVSD